ncbi:MAG: hypothetical protein KDD40_01925 [Bdellovibrionales bacterium]|nr:hypothetical protein [Bdellovibrionales bacterium]
MYFNKLVIKCIVLSSFGIYSSLVKADAWFSPQSVKYAKGPKWDHLETSQLNLTFGVLNNCEQSLLERDHGAVAEAHKMLMQLYPHLQWSFYQNESTYLSDYRDKHNYAGHEAVATSYDIPALKLARAQHLIAKIKIRLSTNDDLIGQFSGRLSAIELRAGSLFSTSPRLKNEVSAHIVYGIVEDAVGLEHILKYQNSKTDKFPLVEKLANNKYAVPLNYLLAYIFSEDPVIQLENDLIYKHVPILAEQLRRLKDTPFEVNGFEMKSYDYARLIHKNTMARKQYIADANEQLHPFGLKFNRIDTAEFHKAQYPYVSLIGKVIDIEGQDPMNRIYTRAAGRVASIKTFFDDKSRGYDGTAFDKMSIAFDNGRVISIYFHDDMLPYLKVHILQKFAN